MIPPSIGAEPIILELPILPPSVRFAIGDRVRFRAASEAVKDGDVRHEDIYVIQDGSSMIGFDLVLMAPQPHISEKVYWVSPWELEHIRHGVDWMLTIL